jgi:hypothetical protein
VLVSLESERPLLLGADSVSALVLVFWGNDDFGDWGRCGTDFVLVLVFVSCEDIALWWVDSGLDAVRMRVRDGG